MTAWIICLVFVAILTPLLYVFITWDHDLARRYGYSIVDVAVLDVFAVFQRFRRLWISVHVNSYGAAGSQNTRNGDGGNVYFDRLVR